NPQNGVSYSVAVRTPLSKINALDALTNTPVTAPGLAAPQLFGNLATATRQTTFAVVNHYNTQPVSDVYAAVDDRDLGGVASDVRHRVDAVRDPDHLQCPLIDGEHHGPGRRHRQQRAAHHVRG